MLVVRILPEDRSLTIHIKRVYETPAETDGVRILVDRLWPRGLSKAAAQIDFWAKAISPSTPLRRWYGHDAAKWPEFKARYYAELEDSAEGVEEVLEHRFWRRSPRLSRIRPDSDRPLRRRFPFFRLD